MATLAYAVGIYLALTLGVSGIAKLRDPRQFVATLHRQGFLPVLIIDPVGYLLPPVQLLVSFLILTTWSSAVAAVTAALFAIFLAVESYVLVTGRATNCGCFGVVYPIRVDVGSLVATGVQLGMTALLVIGTEQEPPALVVRITATIATGAYLVFLLWRSFGPRIRPMLRRASA